MGAILILYVTRDRGLSPEGIGFAFSIGSVGVLVAALVTSRITARVGVGPDARAVGDRVQPVRPAGRARRRTS